MALKDITLGQYFPGNSVIHRMDPRMKLILTILYIVGVFIVANLPGYAIALAFLYIVVRVSGIKFSYLAKGVKPLRFIIIFTFILNLFFVQGETPIFTLGFFTLTKEALNNAIYFALRLIFLVMGTSVLTLTTSPVQLTDGRTLPAMLVGADSVSDLAVLHIDTTGLTPAQFGDSDSLRVGDTVVAIGDPLGVKFRGTYTDGIISGIGRDMDMDGRTMTLIQTNAALNSGNSGGPLINCYGQVIGINTMKIGAFTDSAGVEGLGFAITSSTVKEVAEQLISQGYVSGRPTLGLEGESLSSFDQYYYRLPAGLYITDVDRSSDAAAKGIEEGDILLSVNGTNVTTMDALNGAVYNLDVGDTVEVVIYRSGKQYRVSLTVTEDKG